MSLLQFPLKAIQSKSASLLYMRANTGYLMSFSLLDGNNKVDNNKMTGMESCRDLLLDHVIEIIKNSEFEPKHIKKLGLVIGLNNKMIDSKILIERIMKFIWQCEDKLNIKDKTVVLAMKNKDDAIQDQNYCLMPSPLWFIAPQVFSLYTLLVRSGLLTRRDKDLDYNLSMLNKGDLEETNCVGRLYGEEAKKKHEDGSWSSPLGDSYVDNTVQEFTESYDLLKLLFSCGVENIFFKGFIENWQQATYGESSGSCWFVDILQGNGNYDDRGGQDEIRIFDMLNPKLRSASFRNSGSSLFNLEKVKKALEGKISKQKDNGEEVINVCLAK